MNFKAIPIPERMQRLPRDARGYPIPFLVFVDSEGKPHFTINDHRKAWQCRTEDRCGICGDTLFRGRWFVGGPKAALHEHGAYIDAPMHDECAHYALQVCPYLAAPRWTKELGAFSKPADGLVLVDPTQDPERPALFVAVMAIGHTITEPSGYYRPKRPYRKLEYWLQGKEITAREAASIVAEYMKEES